MDRVSVLSSAQYDCDGFNQPWIKNFDCALWCKCSLEWIFSAVCIADLVRCYNINTLTNTKDLLDYSRATITLFCAIIPLSTLACDITLFIVCTNLIHELLTVWNSIYWSITSINWFKTAQTHTLPCFSQVISVLPKTPASCWANIRDCWTLTWLAWCLTKFIAKSVYRTRLTLT